MRIITTNAVGNDEWVGIDDIRISALPLTPIYTIQGSGDTSPFTGQTVNTGGIVTGFFKGTLGAREGFYLQDRVGDGNPLTSEGLYVFAGSSGAPLAALQVGDSVIVSGTVGEVATSTRLTSTSFSVISSGNSLPAAVPVTLPFPALTDPERFEGMLVTLEQTLTVTDNFYLGRFGEVTLSSGGILPQPTHIALPGAAALAVQAANDLNRVILDDGSSQQYPDPTPYLFGGATQAENTLRGGDTISGATGVLYSHSSNPAGWRLQPTAAPVFVRANPRSAPPAVGGNLKVAGISAYNFFTELGSRGATNATEFDRQRAHLVAALVSIDADIFGLSELQNNGYGTGSALAALVAALNAAVTNGSVYAFVSHTGYPAPPVDADAIMCGFIYKTNTVELVGNSVFNADSIFIRPPLAQTFRKSSNGEKITVCVNHFKSKGVAGTNYQDQDQGDGQGANNYTRTQQSQALATWLTTFPTGDSDPDILIIGNLNAFAKEDPIASLVKAGYTNLTERDQGATGFTFNINGQWGHLDHALATPGLAARVNRAEAWHCNSPEPRTLDYNTEFKSANQQLMNSGATPWRFSDHDPILIGINLDSPSPLQTWRALHGLASDGSQDLASAASDGVANLLKYAFNMAPNADDLPRMNVSVLAPGGNSGLARIFRDGNGRLVVEFVRRKAATNPGINYQVQTGEDLTNLQPLDLTGATLASLDTTWERVTATDPAVTAKRFGRLNISTFGP
ncbi:MAG: ExeM/NucH family extracellular endonuclease [Verrucomicrobia bacterium]|nr:ExeM/NucH family extracellular endonuclease [Verrucomicrobiota bacterium]